ncbi:MAG: transglutaminase domain-containing protein [Polaribacter sp.]
MKQLLSLLLFFSLSIYSQDFTNVDEKIANYPTFSKVEQLASKIAKDFTSDEDKVRAAFVWLATNIRYNLDEYYNRTKTISFRYITEEEKLQKLQEIKDTIVAKAFLTKQGVCEEYAQSFTKICDLLGIESEVIKGYVRDDASEIGKIPTTTNHAWNGVKLNNKWVILDITWAAGYMYNGKWIREFNNYFYAIPKEKIFKTHFPDDKIWVLRFGRMSLNEFYKQPIYGNSFLSSNTEFISPKKGIINITSSGNIELKFKNLSENSLVFYVFRGERLAQKPIIKKENNISTFTIKNPKRNTELMLFIDREDALQFKVN